METPVLVAIIAGFISFIGLVISKEQKVSEFRQEWINKLREDISSLIGAVSELYHSWLIVVEDKSINDLGKQFIKDKVTVVKEINSIAAKCRLRLNPKKDNEMIDILNKVEEFASSPKTLESDNFINVVGELERISHDVFKTEWDRVKRGELYYVILKWFLGVFVVVWLVGISYFYFAKHISNVAGNSVIVAPCNVSDKNIEKQKPSTENQNFKR